MKYITKRWENWVLNPRHSACSVNNLPLGLANYDEREREMLLVGEGQTLFFMYVFATMSLFLVLWVVSMLAQKTF